MGDLAHRHEHLCHQEPSDVKGSLQSLNEGLVRHSAWRVGSTQGERAEAPSTAPPGRAAREAQKSEPRVLSMAITTQKGHGPKQSISRSLVTGRGNGSEQPNKSCVRNRSKVKEPPSAENHWYLIKQVLLDSLCFSQRKAT